MGKNAARPMNDNHTPTILLGHGSGGLMTHRLVQQLFAKKLHNQALAPLDDAARVQTGSGDLAVSTDGFVVDPLFFPGGDIGELAVCGTVNDLLVSGARPAALTAGFILEEGLPLGDLERIVDSMAAAAREAGVAVVAGDTKVVPRGKGDGCYITTAGVGVRAPGMEVSAALGVPGDRVVVSGTVGQHGAAVMAARAGVDRSGAVLSDCAPLTALLEPLLQQPQGFHTMRDPTRGGLGTTLCELAGAAQVTMEIDEPAIPLSEPVRTTCELMGLDALQLACEGRVVVLAEPAAAQRVLESFQAHEQGRQAAIIGQLQQGPARVVLQTAMGGRRLITMPASDPLPRIC